MEKDEHASDPFVRLFAEGKSLSGHALEILSALWRVETGKRHDSHIIMFLKFCLERCTEGTTVMGIVSLTTYFKTGVGYSSVNSARSALPSIIKPVCYAPFGNSL